jgi:MFS family permease
MRKFNLKILLILSLGHLVTDIYQGALPAVLPFLKDNLSLSYTMTGIILMAANFISSLIQPLFGFISDKQKKALLLPVGCLCAGIGFSLLSLYSNYLFIIMLVVISGFGIASCLMVGFAIGAGGICVTLLGVVTDYYGVPFALKSITILPFIGFILSTILKYPKQSRERAINEI